MSPVAAWHTWVSHHRGVIPQTARSARSWAAKEGRTRGRALVKAASSQNLKSRWPTSRAAGGSQPPTAKSSRCLHPATPTCADPVARACAGAKRALVSSAYRVHAWQPSQCGCLASCNIMHRGKRKCCQSNDVWPDCAPRSARPGGRPRAATRNRRGLKPQSRQPSAVSRRSLRLSPHPLATCTA